LQGAARPWMPRLLRPEIGTAMLARQRAAGYTPVLQPPPPNVGADGTAAGGGTSSGAAHVGEAAVGSLAEQWILFKMDVELDNGEAAAAAGPEGGAAVAAAPATATLTVREGDVPSEIATAFVAQHGGEAAFFEPFLHYITLNEKVHLPRQARDKQIGKVAEKR
jgi:hypothetical protein